MKPIRNKLVVTIVIMGLCIASMLSIYSENAHALSLLYDITGHSLIYQKGSTAGGSSNAFTYKMNNGVRQSVYVDTIGTIGDIYKNGAYVTSIRKSVNDAYDVVVFSSYFSVKSGDVVTLYSDHYAYDWSGNEYNDSYYIENMK